MRGQVSEVMTARPRAVGPDTSVAEAAQIMEVEDVGSLPVIVEGTRLIGIVTDRDIAIRVVAKRLDPERTTVGQIASKDVVAVHAEDDVDDALALMAKAQVRRIPVVSADDELIGVIAQADIALAAKEKEAGQVLQDISKPPSGPRL